MNILTLDRATVKALALKQVVPALLMMGLIITLYFLSYYVAAGTASYAISFVALSVVILTALARVNDIGIELSGWRWETRRLGLVMTASGAAGVILMTGHPTWKETMVYVGLALTWFTTPGMPPWWRYIGGKEGCLPTDGGLASVPVKLAP